MVASRGLCVRFYGIQSAVCAALISVGCSAPGHPPVFVESAGGSVAAGGDGVDSSDGDTGGAPDPGDTGVAGESQPSETAGTTGVIGGTPGTGIGTGSSITVDVVAPLASDYKTYGIASVTAPYPFDYGLAGLAGIPRVALKDSKVLYTVPNSGSPELRTFAADSADTLPADTVKNDVVFDTPPCTDGPIDFKTSPDGHVIYRCTSGWFDTGKLVYGGGAPISALGNKSLVLALGATSLGVMFLTDGVIHNITGLGHYVALRASATGFHFVQTDSSGSSLVAVDATGTGKLLGNFPAAAVQFAAYSWALAADDSLYELGYAGDVPTIMRFTFAGKSETVYSAKSGDGLDLGHGFLLTGP